MTRVSALSYVTPRVGIWLTQRKRASSIEHRVSGKVLPDPTWGLTVDRRAVTRARATRTDSPDDKLNRAFRTVLGSRNTEFDRSILMGSPQSIDITN